MSNMELRGHMEKLKQDNYALDVKADATVKAIRHLLFTACITEPIEDCDVEGAASLVAELIEIKGNKIRNLATLKRIERELQ